MSRHKYSRRAFLEAAGLSGILLPLVGTDKVQAAVTGAPRRLITIGWTNGYIMEEWRPKGSGSNFTFGEILKPLTPYKDKTIVVDGVGQTVHYQADPKALGWGKDQWYGGHDAHPAAFTGVPLSVYTENVFKSGGDSIDQFIANDLAKQNATPIPSLVTGPFADPTAWGTFSYRGASAGVNAEPNPFNLWNKLFQGKTLPQGGVDKTLLRRQSVLDYVGTSLTGFGSRLGKEDKSRIDAHLQSVRDIEKQLTALATSPAAQGCAAQDIGAPFDTRNTIANYPKVLTLLLDIVVAALRCDLTRVVSMPWSTCGGDQLVFSWLGAEFTGKGDEYPIRQYHDITHMAGKSPEHRARKIRVEQWFFEQVAYLVKKLSESPEGTGSMLDNTLVAVTNTMGTNHDSHVQPFTLVGNLGGYFKTGQYLKVAMGEAHNRVLVGLANGMGVDGSKFGAARFATELPGLKAS